MPRTSGRAKVHELEQRHRHHGIHRSPSAGEIEQVHRNDTDGIGDVSIVLEMQVTRDRVKGTLTISRTRSTKPVLETYGMEECKPLYTIGVGPERSINRGERKL
ncbi:MAG: hypothetical protein ABJ084_06150 [Halioglobus sp.]